MRRATFLFCALAGLFLNAATGSPRSRSQIELNSENGAAGVQPILRLEKPRYVLGEEIRFWIGAASKSSSGIPEQSRMPCSLTISRPDGTHKVESVGWPSDGDPRGGWYGGWGLGDERVQAGSYTLVFECAGEKTEPVKMIVEKNDVIDQITAGFHFDRSGMIKMSDPVRVILTVNNNSKSTIRFPQRGAMDEGISVSVRRGEPGLRAEFFYPWEKLSNPRTMPGFTYTWSGASQVPSVVVNPGQHFEQQLSLKDAYSFDRAADYEVTFGTVLSVLVGRENGQFSNLCPIRLLATGSAKFVVSSPE
jgi:hypothetical protein